MTEQAASGTAAHLDFYLDRGCVVVPCQRGQKKLRRGAGDWTVEDSRTRRDELTGNAAVRNGTGGLLVVDIDAKHGGSLDLMAERFPGSTMTRTIQTVSPGENGRLGAQLIYTLPDGFRIGSGRALVSNAEGAPMIEVAAFAMLPGSRARGSDGVMRTYTVVRDVSVNSATPELLAAVEGRTLVEVDDSDMPEMKPTEARQRLDALLAQIVAAGDGQRNSVFTRYALPVARLCDLLGEDPEHELTEAYEYSGGVDSSWVRSAVRSAIRRAGDGPIGWTHLGPLAAEELLIMRTRARLAAWPGKSGASDRRVFLALVDACMDFGRMETPLSTRKLAVRAGVTRETVEASLKRLQAAGRVETVKQGEFTMRRPFLRADDTTHILSPLLVRENNYLSNNEDGSSGEGVDPLHPVWSSPKTPEGLGLDGRHGQLLDLVCAGLTTARALADHVGSRQDSIKRTLDRLTEVYLLAEIDGRYVPADNVAELADRLALELGGVEVCAYREDQYRNEEQRWDEFRQWQKIRPRWDRLTGEQWWELPDGTRIEAQAPPAPVEPPALTDDEIAALQQEHDQQQSDERRRWEDEQLLLRQFGLPNELGML
ncbi:bifunctional DNA primase/polymerase [Nocardia otitidiscaviarum]|uniref:bifunctional DNA primase/polymerase n=1 Tax=Nocardia otitidiscaviarum TaxID=1823 RepID=UPI0002FC1981|nr:bifunctional DNA primase/polymerase [Nocardia otitidiscaviarum]